MHCQQLQLQLSLCSRLPVQSRIVVKQFPLNATDAKILLHASRRPFIQRSAVVGQYFLSRLCLVIEVPRCTNACALSSCPSSMRVQRVGMPITSNIAMCM